MAKINKKEHSTPKVSNKPQVRVEWLVNGERILPLHIYYATDEQDLRRCVSYLDEAFELWSNDG